MLSELAPFTYTHELKFTQPPNPKWTFGQRIEATSEGKAWAEEGQKAGWTVIDAESTEPRKLYSILSSGIIPRPIAFVSSISEDGFENLAPFSWFNEVAPSPPLIVFSCLTSSKTDKDTSRNIKATKGFTVNIISEPWIEQAHAASIDTPYGVSEWPITGLTKASSVHVKAARVEESAFSLECELQQSIDIPDPKTNEIATVLILGLVKYIHMRNDIIDPVRGGVLPGKLRAISRLGGVHYGRVTEAFSLGPKPSWKDVME